VRFELYLTKLPDLRPDEIKSKLGNLPALSGGVLKKALESKSLPTIAVGWSERRADADQVVRRLGTLGGACRVVDHAPIWVKVWAGIEDLCSALFDSVKALVTPAERPKLKAPPDKSKKPSALSPHLATAFHATLVFLFKWTLAGGIYALSAINEAATTQSVTIDGIVIEVLIVAVGLLCAQALSSAVTGLMKHQLAIKIAVPMFVLPILVVSAAALNVQATVEAAPPVVKPKVVVATQTFAKNLATSLPPRPSRPYQGLFEELRLRKLRHSEAVFDEVRVTDAAPGELPAGVPSGPAVVAQAPAEGAQKTPAAQPGAAAPAPQAAVLPASAPPAAQPPAPPLAATPTASAPAAVAAPEQAEAAAVASNAVTTAPVVTKAAPAPLPLARKPSPARVAPRVERFAPLTGATELWLLALAIVLGARAFERKHDRRKLAQLSAEQTRGREEHAAERASSADARTVQQQATESLRAELAEAEQQTRVLTRELEAVRDALERATAKRAAEAPVDPKRAARPAIAAAPPQAARVAFGELPTVADESPDDSNPSEAEAGPAHAPARPARDQLPVGAVRVAATAQRSGRQQKGAAYAAFDVKEERISLGKRDKR
jgi:hypothetical protein